MSFCNAIFLLVAFAVTVTTGQYQILTTYTDNQCTNANGGVHFTYTGPECYSDTNCNSVNGLYTKLSCVDTDPLLSLTTEATFVYYSTADLSCNNFSTYTEALAAPLNVCFAGTGIFKLTGCESGNTTFIYQVFDNLDNCNNGIVRFEGDFVSGKCRPGTYDAVGTCQGYTSPPVAPVAPPVSPPMTPPVAVPVSTPTTSSVPTSTPVATPVKKVNSATSNTMLGIASLAILLLIWA